jgi:hypothetical protein
MAMNKVLPIWLAVRPLAPSYQSVDLDTMHFTGRKTVIQQKQCYELTRVQEKIVFSVWVDPSQDYSVLRLLDTDNEKITRKIDIRYRRFGNDVFLPEAWDLLSFRRSGDISFAAHATVTDVNVNPEVAVEDIPVVYPDGAVVSRVKGGTQRYSIIVPGGKERPILPGDYSLSYDELLSKKAAFDYTFGLSTRTFWFLVACILAPIAVFLWKKRALVLRRRF